jgi:hypothetical protein
MKLKGAIPEHHPLWASPDEWADAAQDDTPIEEVRRQLAGIRRTLSDGDIRTDLY